MREVYVKYNYQWSIISSEHEVMCRKVFPVTEIDEIICNIILTEGGEIQLNTLGLMLGFAMEDLVVNEEIRFFKDQSEINILKNILKDLIQFHLISVDTQNITLTKWGEWAVKQKQKFKFCKGIINIFNHLNFKVISDYFPIDFASLNLFSEVKDIKEIDPYEISDSLTEFGKLIESYFMLCDKNATLILDFVSEEFSSKRVIEKDLMVTLAKDRDTLELFYNNVILKDVTNSLQINDNLNLKEFLKKKGLFEYMISSESIIKSSDLHDYKDFFNWREVINSNRIDWTDQNVLNFFLQPDVSNGTIWLLISEKCPFEKLWEKIDVLSNYLNWSILTEIAPVDLVFDNFHLPWDLTMALEKLPGDRILDFVKKKLLNIPSEEYTLIFDIEHWNIITAKIPVATVGITLNEFPYNYRFIARNYEDLTKDKILQEKFVALDWDWNYISNNYELDFLSANFKGLANYLDPERLFLRICSEEERLLRFLRSGKAIELKQRLIADEIKISHHDAVLNDLTIPLLDSHNLLFWGSDLIPGAEANINILWTKKLFHDYGSKLISVRAIDQVSRSFEDVKIILENPSFKWNYINVFNALKKDDLIGHLQDLLKIVPEINLPIIYSIISSKFNIQDLLKTLNVFPSLAKELDIRRIFENTSFDQLLKNIGALNNYWSFFKERKDTSISVCTEFTPLDYILEHIELEWDWQYITRAKMPAEEIDTFFDEYAGFLDWEHIVKKILTEDYLNDISKLTEIAVYLDQASDEISSKAWSVITSAIYPENIWTVISSTSEYGFFKWDWSVISGSSQILFSKFNDLAFLWNNRDKIDWKAFTSNKLFKSWIKRLDVETVPRWFKRTTDFVDKFIDYLPWDTLSRLNDFTWFEEVINKYLRYWDWSILSENSKCFTRFNEEKNRSFFIQKPIRKFYKYIDFFALTSRADVIIESGFIQEYGHESLNWPHLSSNTNFKIRREVFIREVNANEFSLVRDFNNKFIADKEWDYKELSSREDFDLDSILVQMLSDKPWDWFKLSEKSFLTNDLIHETSDKPWDYSVICKNENLIFDINLLKLIISKAKDFAIDWLELSSLHNFHVTNETLSLIPDEYLANLNWESISAKPSLSQETLTPNFLDKYGGYLNWRQLLSTKKIILSESIIAKYHRYISPSDLARYISLDILQKREYSFIKDILDWSVLSNRQDVSVLLKDTEFIELNKRYLDWSNLSSNVHLPFTESFIKMFYFHWDWNNLLQNPIIKENFQQYVNQLIISDRRLDFYIKLTRNYSPWAGYIYHFAHLTNALKIIKEKSIKSRNKAVFEDSAGSVVNRRNDAHSYARFYFRPQTPTQFYNENLGMDYTSEYYGRAFNMGLPKCPIPVFFRFPIKDILFDKRIEFRISNGNMQTGWAIPYPIESISNFFDFGNVYSTIFGTTDGDYRTYINSSQQEFLIKNEFNFSDFADYQIIVPDSIIRKYILDKVDDPTIRNKIIIDSHATNILHGNNKKIKLEYDKQSLLVSTNYSNNHKFQLKFSSEYLIKEINGVDLINKSNSIEFKNNCTISFLNEPEFDLMFYNDIKPQPWTIMHFGSKGVNK